MARATWAQRLLQGLLGGPWPGLHGPSSHYVGPHHQMITQTDPRGNRHIGKNCIFKNLQVTHASLKTVQSSPPRAHSQEGGCGVQTFDPHPWLGGHVQEKTAQDLGPN